MHQALLANLLLICSLPGCVVFGPPAEWRHRTSTDEQPLSIKSASSHFGRPSEAKIDFDALHTHCGIAPPGSYVVVACGNGPLYEGTLVRK